MRIVFMGTPDFAAASLQALLSAGHTVVGAFTQPDKPKGRGNKLQAPPVKELALSAGIPVYQPASLRTGEALAILRDLAPELIAVVAYGKLLPKDVLTLPPRGCVNVHGSLLPAYRGAAPIQRSVLEGETRTGVTTMFMDEGLDTGDILLTAETPIGPDETASELYDRLAALGADLLVQTIEALEQGTVIPQKQDDSLATHAPMLTKVLSPIDFTKPAALVHNQIRGLSEWPCATCFLKGKRMKVLGSHLVDEKTTALPGTLLSERDFLVACGENTVIQFTLVQPDGGKRMPGSAFLRGQRAAVGDRLSATEE